MVAGLEPVTSGRIAIGGTDVTLRAANERDVSMVFQSYALFPHMKRAGERLLRPAVDARPTRRRRASSRSAKLEMLGLAGLGDRLPSELSGGQQQRVAVARSLVLEPAVLLFDEPLSNLDAKLRRRVRQEIRDLQQSLALTVIYVTHDQEEALAVSDHIIVMDGGRIAQKGTPRELYEAPASRFLADFIGDANLVDGELDDGQRRPDVHRGRRRRCRARATASPPAPPRSRCGRTGCVSSRRAGQRAGRVQARRLPRQPDRVHGRDAVGRAPRVRRRGAASRGRATSGSAWRSIRTPRSSCGASASSGGPPALFGTLSSAVAVKRGLSPAAGSRRCHRRQTRSAIASSASS